MYHFVPSTYKVHTIFDGVSRRWAAAELKKVIAMLQNPEFDSKDIDPDLHHLVESVALADSNFNVACETGICYPSLVAMLNCRSMLWHATVISHVMHVHISTYLVQTSTSQYVQSMYSECLVMNRLM